MKQTSLRTIIYIVIALNAVIIFWWWLAYSGLPASTSSARLIALGRLSGLIAAFCALIELFLMSRLPSIERALGLERLVKIHRWNGQAVFYTLIAHPIFLSFGYQINGKPSVINQFLTFITSYPDMMKALIGSILFLGVAGFSYGAIRKRISYEVWYIIHLTAYIAIVLAFFHQLSTGGDFIGHRLFSLYWFGLIVLTFALIGVYRFLSPVLIFLSHNPRVDRVVTESKGVYSLYIKGSDFSKLQIQAGQYFGFQFLGNHLWAQSHPFTISKVPTDNEIRITFKVYGSYTAHLSKIASGTPVLLDGPRGNSTWERSRLSKTIMIAGGIGITPMRALVEAAPAGQDIVLMYSTRDIDSAPILDEFKTIKTKASLKLYPVFTKVTGRLTPGQILQTAPDLSEREIYMCGPHSMVDELDKYFRTIGISKDDIHVERFEY